MDMSKHCDISAGFIYNIIIKTYIDKSSSLTNGQGVLSQVSCVGGFGSNSAMYKINGTANINAIMAAAEKGMLLLKLPI
jgi:hypothetical protein